MQDVEVFVEGEQVVLRAPFNPDLGPFVDDMGAKWDQDRGLYTFPVHLAEHVQALAESFFGTSGNSALSTVEIELQHYSDQCVLELGGRLIAERRQRSRRPILGKGIARIRGSFTWEGLGGPFTKPLIGVNDVLVLASLPTSVVARPIPGVTIVPTMDRGRALRSEAARLQARLEVITKELAA
ncbi:hypothetical protein [Specibacter sp. RAF43]|uniref:hypothetical protein n=1 Tax=Specibacter sp. RAF43 TaxID=3233057 RepID=UPI003F979758